MTVSIPGARGVTATLDSNAAHEQAADGSHQAADGCVVACPPHPQHGGHRGDKRLVAVGEQLTAKDVDCLRIDYGDWDEGHGELEDARNAVRWAADQYDQVGLFGFSFGGAIAMLAAATVDRPVRVVSVLGPAPRLGPDLDAVEAVPDVDCPIQLIYGERDDTVDATELAAAVRSTGAHEATVSAVAADHFFVGQQDSIAARVADFCVPYL